MTIMPTIQSLAETVVDSQALNNAFFRCWMTGPLQLREVEIFARNYMARTNNTATMAALTLTGARELNFLTRSEILKTLYSEYGGGNPEKIDIALLNSYLQDLLSRLAGRPYDLCELETYPILASTRAFIAERSLYTDSGNNKNSRLVLGTQLSQEWLARPMLTRLYEGARNYQHLYKSSDEFHEHCAYFYVHIGDAEKGRKIQAIKAAARGCDGLAQVDELVTSFNRFLEITSNYWNGIALAMREEAVCEVEV